MMDSRLLEQIGLTKGEINVYFALLELGSCTVGPIIKKSKISSSKVYDVLNRLINKGLVSHVIKENIKYFEAASPKRIKDYLTQKQESLQKQSKELDSVMPQLLARQSSQEKKQEVNIYEGVKGIKTAHEKTLQELKKGEEFYFMGASLLSSEKFRNYFQDHHKRREKAGIFAKILFNTNVPKSELENREQFKKVTTKYMPFNINTPSWIEIFKDTTILGVPSENPIALEIKNKDVTQTFRSYFEALWSQDVKTFEGNQQVTQAFEELVLELKTGDEYHVINGNQGWPKIIPDIREFFKKMHIKRSSKGIKFKALFNSTMEGHIDEVTPQPSEHKFLSADFKSPLQIVFSKSKLYFVLWTKNSIGFMIEKEEVIQAFKAYFNNLWDQKVIVHEGNKRVIQALQNFVFELKKGEEYYAINGNYGIINSNDEMVPDIRDFFISFHQKRSQKQIKVNALFNVASEKFVKKIIHNPCEYKFLPPDFKSPLAILFHKNKVFIVSWSKNSIAFEIKEKAIIESFKVYFDNLWNQDESQILRGEEGVKIGFKDVVDHLESGEEVNIMGVHAFSDKFKKYALEFQKNRSKKGVKANFLINHDAKEIAQDFSNYKPVEIRLMKPGIQTPAIFLIYKDKIIINLTDEFTFILIKNQRTADAFNVYFKELWEQSKKLI
jgi:sugar-specific transcriptional regulator TrmB